MKMDRGLQNPVRKKPKGIRITPRMIRTTLSPCATFFEIAISTLLPIKTRLLCHVGL
jgi:hypothetical protein